MLCDLMVGEFTTCDLPPSENATELVLKIIHPKEREEQEDHLCCDASSDGRRTG